MAKKKNFQKVKVKAKNQWVEEDMANAIHEYQSVPGVSIRGVAKKHGVDESTLRFRLKKKNNNKELGRGGRRNALGDETEEELATCIGVVCNHGFCPTKDNILDIVQDYLTMNKIFPTEFKSNDNRPGMHWMGNFMARNKLSNKKAEMISAPRKSATANPFIIYDFFDKIEQVLKERPEIDESRIWNCDESGFPTDPSKGKVVTIKGEKALRMRYGAGRENITVLGVSCADGTVLDPLIVFKGKNILTSWYGDEALPNTWYGKSENGWMETSTFTKWFFLFCEKVTERPLLLLFDGHLTHISIAVIKKAIEEDIIIIKFPPHVTDVLQPLDVSCFGPLKRAWDKNLHNRVSVLGIKQPLTKCEFVNELCKVWPRGMTKENAISGFQKTGIFPVDRSKYPERRLDPRLLKKFVEWKATGEPLDWDKLADDEIEFDVATSTDTTTDPSKLPQPDLDQPSISTANKENIQPRSCNVSTPKSAEPNAARNISSKSNQETLLTLIGPYPFQPTPPGFHWIPKWELVPDQKQQQHQQTHPSTTSNTTPNTTPSNTSFEELFLNRIKPQNEKKANRKRQKLDLRGQVVTQKEFLDAIEAKEAEKEEKERQKAERKRLREEKKKETEAAKKESTGKKKAAKARKKKKLDDEYNYGEESFDEMDEEVFEEGMETEESEGLSSEGEQESESVIDKPLPFRSDFSRLYVMEELWRKFSAPNMSEDEIVGSWFGVIFSHDKSDALYIGQAKKRFIHDEEGITVALAMDCCERKLGTSDNILKKPRFDEDIFPVDNIICGPLEMIPQANHKWICPDYQRVHKHYLNVKKVNRKCIFNDFFNEMLPSTSKT